VDVRVEGGTGGVCVSVRTRVGVCVSCVHAAKHSLRAHSLERVYCAAQPSARERLPWVFPQTISLTHSLHSLAVVHTCAREHNCSVLCAQGKPSWEGARSMVGQKPSVSGKRKRFDSKADKGKRRSGAPSSGGPRRKPADFRKTHKPRHSDRSNSRVSSGRNMSSKFTNHNGASASGGGAKYERPKKPKHMKRKLLQAQQAAAAVAAEKKKQSKNKYPKGSTSKKPRQEK
jgi:hypothetical protein